MTRGVRQARSHGMSCQILTAPQLNSLMQLAAVRSLEHNRGFSPHHSQVLYGLGPKRGHKQGRTWLLDAQRKERSVAALSDPLAPDCGARVSLIRERAGPSRL
jgi:hypothetical protein